MPGPQSHLTALKAFASSSKNFQIIRSIPQTASFSNAKHLKTLYILDSSFNPPTLAHLRICTSALRDDPKAVKGEKRLLLLLATQNADKPSKPAAFEHRLEMMCLFAQDLYTKSEQDKDQQGNVPIDVGVTKLPIFVDKVKEIADSGVYSKEVEQVHLFGFDTLVRLLDTRYYPPEYNLQPLAALFGKHRVRVTRRTDDQWGGREEQDAYIRALAEGKREGEGGKKEWAEKVELVEGRKDGEEIISSTKVREAVRRENKEALERLVTREVAEWILGEEPYNEDG